MALISPTFSKRNPINREGFSSRRERLVGQGGEDNPSSRQGASGRSKRRPGSDCAIDTTLTRQVSISDAKDEEISTNIATNHIHRFTTTVQKCKSNYQTNSNQQNILKQNLSNKLTNMYTNRQSNAGKCCLNLKCHTSNSTVNQDRCHVRKKGTRSRHSLFYSDNKQALQTCCQFRHRRHRDREPSRISVKQLRRKLKLIKKSQLLF
jgi:hypothetical protein